jgi:hypothetical protein
MATGPTGTDILLMNYVCSSPFNFQPPHQDITVHLNLPSLSFTLCSVYFLLGVDPTAPADLTNLISLLSPSFILLVDFNTKYILWGISPVMTEAEQFATKHRFTYVSMPRTRNLICPGPCSL